MKYRILIVLTMFIIVLTSCQISQTNHVEQVEVVAAESFLADIVQNVAGDRLEVINLIPSGVDPHTFQPTPKEVALLSECNLLIINGGGLEEWLTEQLLDPESNCVILEASLGLEPRHRNEVAGEHEDHGDPHFWLNPVMVETYVVNIRDALIGVDPNGEMVYRDNADNYIQQLQQLDLWIENEVQKIPEEKRIIVTNHESFGYFADRYGFEMAGAVIPSVSTGASPSAKQLSELIQLIEQRNIPAIFLEAGSNSELANQIASETEVTLIFDLYTHSLPVKGQSGSSYIDMMKWNVEKIVTALQ